MEKLKGVIFDMDGLLFDTEKLYYEATQIVARKMNIPYTKDTYLRFLGVSDEEVWQAYHKMYDEAFGTETVEAFIAESFEQVLRMFQAGAAEVKPGVQEFLAYLNGKKIPRVLASSNQRKLITVLLEKSGLAPEFPTIVCVDDVKRAKPDPEIFLKAQASLGLSKEEIVIFEDSQNGIIAANRAEIPVIMVPDLLPPTEDLATRAIEVLSSLYEAPTYLEKKYLL